MTGEYQHALDNKGRIFIPARLREELGQAVFVTLSMDRCLSVYSKENWDLLTERSTPFHMSASVKCGRYLPMQCVATWMHRGESFCRRICGTGPAW